MLPSKMADRKLLCFAYYLVLLSALTLTHALPAKTRDLPLTDSPYEASSTSTSTTILPAEKDPIKGRMEGEDAAETGEQSGRGAVKGENDIPEPERSLDRQGSNEVDTEEEDVKHFATAFLQHYGYFQPRIPLHLEEEQGSEGQRTSREKRAATTEDLKNAISEFQNFAGLPNTGTLDNATLEKMQQPRCGDKDVADQPLELTEGGSQHQTPNNVLGDSQSPSDYSLLGSVWHKNRLTWRLDNLSHQLRPTEQRRTMEDAFAMWSQVVPLSFEHKSGRGPVDIQIKFARLRHGDDYPFDGKGKVLAHAFGPGEGSISGDMHLDNDEQWSVDLNHPGSSNLFLVSAHELGHSLGLAHSRDPSALMYPYYGLTDSLNEDDIKAIQSLYGIRIGKPPVTPKPRKKMKTTTTTPEPITRFQWAKSATYARFDFEPQKTESCRLKFDVVFQDDSRNPAVYTGIQGDQVYRFEKRGVLNGYPATLNSMYPGAPSNAEAVFAISAKSATYFIKDNKVWRFEGSVPDPANPKDLIPSHFRETIRFVLPVTDATGAQRIFVFGRTLWLDYNFDSFPSHPPNAHVIPQYWPDVAIDVKYAVTGYDGYFYFISPNSHVVLNSFRRTLHGGKREGHPDWLQPACHATSVASRLSSLPSSGSILVMAFFVISICAPGGVTS